MLRYEQLCRLVLVPALGDLPIRELTRAHVREMHESAHATPQSANMTLTLGRMLWRFGEDRGLVDGPNPFTAIRPHRTTPRRSPVTQAQAREIWRVCEDASERPDGDKVSAVFALYFQALLLTGLRMGEGMALRHDDRDDRTLTLREHKTARQKGAKRIELSEAACAHFERIAERRWHHEWCFPSPRSSTGHITGPYKAWRAVCAAAGCPGATLHDMRRGFADAAHEAGADIKTIATLLGHSSITTTQKYIRTSAKRSRAAADSVAAAFLGKAGDL